MPITKLSAASWVAAGNWEPLGMAYFATRLSNQFVNRVMWHSSN